MKSDTIITLIIIAAGIFAAFAILQAGKAKSEGISIAPKGPQVRVIVEPADNVFVDATTGDTVYFPMRNPNRRTKKFYDRLTPGE